MAALKRRTPGRAAKEIVTRLKQFPPAVREMIIDHVKTTLQLDEDTARREEDAGD